MEKNDTFRSLPEVTLGILLGGVVPGKFHIYKKNKTIFLQQFFILNHGFQYHFICLVFLIIF
jgi:hypothetical protein